MEIKTEKTHTVVMDDSELNRLRCFIEDAIEADVWFEYPSDFPDDLKTVTEFYEMSCKVVRGGNR